MPRSPPGMQTSGMSPSRAAPGECCLAWLAFLHLDLHLKCHFSGSQEHLLLIQCVSPPACISLTGKNEHFFPEDHLRLLPHLGKKQRLSSQTPAAHRHHRGGFAQPSLTKFTQQNHRTLCVVRAALPSGGPSADGLFLPSKVGMCCEL